MLRKLFRPYRHQLNVMNRSRLEPLMLRIRQSLEEYAEYLDKGDPPTEEDLMPMVYDGPASELEALSNAIPEHPKEEEYLVQRWSMLINQVESSRLAYFDSLYGTRTYYQPSLVNQQRVAVDKILDRSITDNKFDRLSKRETIFKDSEARLKDILMRKDIDREEIEVFNFQEKLTQVPSTVYDPLGRPHVDTYAYLKPAGMQQDDMGVIIRYMELENDRYLMNTHMKGNSVFRSTIEAVTELSSKAAFFRLAPCSGKEYLYFYSQDLQSVVKVSLADLTEQHKATKFSNLIDSLNLKGALPEDSHQTLEEVLLALEKTGASSKLKVLATLEGLREFFFNFKDQVSYSICKYLQFNPLKTDNVSLLTVDPSERFLTIVLKANDAYLTVIYDLKEAKFFSHYFLDKKEPQLSVTKEGEQYVVYRAANVGGKVGIWRHPLDSFITGKTPTDEITSLVRYMTDNQKLLIDNSALFAKSDLLHAFESVRSVELKQSREGLEATCRRYDGGSDAYKVDSSKGLTPVATSRHPQASTASYKYELLISDTLTTIRRFKLGGSGGQPPEKEIKLKYKIKSAVFLDEFVGLVVHAPNSNHDELLNKLTSQSDQLAQLSSGITMMSDLSTMGNSCLVIKSSLLGPKQLHLVNLASASTVPISAEVYEDYNESDVVVEPYIKTSMLDSTFILNRTKTFSGSPLLLWLTDDSEVDSYSPTIHEALKREFVILKVKIRPQKKVNLKALIDEVYSLGIKVTKDELSQNIYLYSHGGLAGIVGLSAHFRNLSVYRGTVFTDPLTDILDIWNENRHSDLGYGDLKEEEKTEQMLDDSPYHSDSLHMASNMLFLSTNHVAGHPSLKLYSRMKHFVTASSQVFWTNLFPRGQPAESVALAYLWSVHCEKQGKRSAN